MTARPSIRAITNNLAAIQRPVAESVTLWLPMPPSTNALTFNKPGGGRAKTKEYDRWLLDAGWLLVDQKPGRIDGPYTLRADFCRPPGRPRKDLGNYEKAVSDLLVKHGVVLDDAFADRIELAWADLDEPGVRVVVRAA